VPAPAFDLRPLSTGEILDRTFSLYRKRFWLFTGLSTVAAGITTLGEFVRLTWGVGGALALQGSTNVTPAAASQQLALVTFGSLFGTLFFYWLAFSITQAATASAVFEIYMGRETSISASFQAIIGKWYRYLLISLWQGWSYVWLPILLVVLATAAAALTKFGVPAWVTGLLFVIAFLSFFYGIYAYIRNSLGIVASVIEDLPVRKSMRRSKALTGGRVLRVLALLLLMFVLAIAVSVAQGIPAFFFTIFFKNSVLRVLLEALTLLMTFMSGALVAPVGTISFALFYIDERVRREGFDVETLMARAIGAGPGPGEAALPSPFSSELV
jgi:hypothetical protein